MASDLGERAEEWTKANCGDNPAWYAPIDAWLAGYRAAIADAAKVVGVLADTNSIGGHVTRMLQAAEEKIRALAPPA